MFAVITIAGKQFPVTKGEEITVPHVAGEVGSTITIDTVLLVSDGAKTSVGTPHVSGANVTAEIVKQGKGEKLNVRRYKQKVRYRRSIGFRATETTLKITNIG